MKYYKILTKRGNRGGFSKFKWDISGKWMSVKGKLGLCENGFHVIRKKNIHSWLFFISVNSIYLHNEYARRYLNLYEVKIKGDKIVDDDKICTRSVRVVKKLEWEDYLK